MVELSLTHDGRLWLAQCDAWAVSGKSLEELDVAVAATLRSKEPSRAGRRVTVRMNFDNSAIPQWMRQYAQHYFNRLVTLELPAELGGETESNEVDRCRPT